MKKEKTDTGVSIVDVAKKQRHASLLKKMQSGKALTRRELSELRALEEPPLPAGVVRTQEEAARILSVTVRTVQNWKRDGMPVTKQGYYDLKEIEKWRRRVRRGEGDGVSERERHDAQLKKWRSLLVKLEYEEARGNLIRREDVEAERTARILAVKRPLLALPKKVAPRLEGLTARQIEVFLREEIKEILKQFSGQ